ncbi:MAG: zinc-ribbon domain-containing protein [Proteobacteria bacterium]|nr:zinc-ribbon domain-containing protein [Pseudomonadota bacterium]
MIIQCRKCETRFRFDDTLMAGDGVWVRCSRCQHVFFQQRSAGDASTVEPEIPSVRISDARRNLDDRFPAAGDRLKRTETQAEAAPPTPIRAEREPEADFGREPSIQELGEDLGKETLFGPAAADEKESVEMAEEEPPEDGTGKTGWGRTLLKLIALLVFVMVVAGTVYLYLFPEIRTQALTWAAPWLRGVPVLENLVAPQMKSGAPAPVRIKDVRQRSVANLLAGNLRVIEGVAVNQAPYPLARIRVRLVIADAYDVVLGEKIVYCGNLLTNAELGALAEAEIQRELSIPQGSDASNERIAPNGEIPFMIVFNQEQAGAIKTTVIPAGADRLP